jgi:hypothetical protein
MIDINELFPRKEIDDRLDKLEVQLSQQPQIDCPLLHYFTPGLYIREIFMPTGALIISKIHNTEHPFVISKGSAYVKVNDWHWELLEAPYTGITYPGTRRVLYIEEDCVWTTFHPTDITPVDRSDEAIQQAVDAIEDVIIEKNDRVQNMIKSIQRKNITECLGSQQQSAQ